MFNKYRAKKVKTDDGTFDSKAELRRWTDLKHLEKYGMIKNLQRQVRFEIVPKTKQFKAVHYIADFVYNDAITDLLVVEDVKGCRVGTAYQMFTLKKKLMYYVHDIIVREVK